MTDRTDRWLLLVVALIGVALLVPAVSAGGTNGQADGWTDWMHTNVWGGDAPDDIGPHAQARGAHGDHHGGGFQGPAVDGHHGPAAGYEANDSRYGEYGPHAGPRHGPHHGWLFGNDSVQDERAVNTSHSGVYANSSAHAHHHGAYVNESTQHHGAYTNESTQHHGAYANGTYYPDETIKNGTSGLDGTLRNDTSDSERRYRGGPGGCH